ncbi:MAG: D-serine ammonia-lyase [Anaerovoracaceae bacterium]
MNQLLNKMKLGEEIFYLHEKKESQNQNYTFTKKDIDDAEARLLRFAPYIQKAFPETEISKGIIESPITEINHMGKYLGISNTLLLKQDSALPISGSVKARGGIYEVLKHAEKLAIENDLLSIDDDYSKLDDPSFKEFFSNYSIAVGSTGNLGLSIGIISAKLGFKVTVHMSSDAREWKKQLLREKGATVIEYPDDYQKAVSEGRKAAQSDPKCHFVDDENSKDLFTGYAVAGKRLKKQFDDLGLEVNQDHQLYVYLPCGVGGAPGGIAFGIKEYFGDYAHIYFAEPTMAPCVTLGIMTGSYDKISVSDIGLTGKTIADGLAVGRASSLVCSIMDSLLDGAFTVDDNRLLPLLNKLYSLEDIFIEPSACAGFCGVPPVDVSINSGSYHLVWATGGNMVPQFERDDYLNSK